MTELTLASILEYLQEPNTWLFERIWAAFTPEELDGILQETKAIEEAGGESTADGSRPRTSGGIFLRLTREHFPTRMAPIIQEQNQVRRKEKDAAMRRKMKSMENDVNVPIELVTPFIGKQGSAIRSLRESAPLCKIHFDAECGVVHIDGPDEETVAAGRTLIFEHIHACILRSHAPYAEEVLLSNFMVAGHRGEHTEEWAKALYSWVETAVDMTPAPRLAATLARLAEAASLEVRQEMKEQLTEKPDLLPARKIVVAIQHALLINEPVQPVTPGRGPAPGTWASMVAGGSRPAAVARESPHSSPPPSPPQVSCN